LIAFGITLTVFVASGVGKAREANEVEDDGSGDDSLPPNLDVLSGRVGNESATHFSVFMTIRSLAAPDDDSEVIYYHFHFQAARTDGTTSLYHAMVHHAFSGSWEWMVQRWLPSGGVGGWGDTHETTGAADMATGALEVRVAKAWVESPKVDIARNTWVVDSFYIHADLVRLSNGTIERSDSAPTAGTQGSYTVSVGAPPGAASGGSALPLLIGALAAGGLVLAVVARRR
jgi:hypothetical protein